jgi:putative transposase
MARLTRLKYSDPDNGYYHIISRSVLKTFLLDDQRKNYFIQQLRRLAQVYFVKVVTYSVMSNHFHLIIKMIDQKTFSDEELRRRFDLYYNEGISRKRRRLFSQDQATRLRQRWSDVSCFVQDLKQRFSRWYNQQTNGQGHVWSERYKSVLLESGRALLACAVYVDLNSVRAGLVERPEEYRFCGLYSMVTGGRAAQWLDHGPIQTVLTNWGIKVTSQKDSVETYLEIVYKRGKKEKEGKGSITENLSKEITADLSFERRIMQFTEGVVLGSRSFCEGKFLEFRRFFRRKKNLEGQSILKSTLTQDGQNVGLFTLRAARRIRS